jgi:hypothetical protein
METATLIKSVKRLFTLNGRGCIPANTEVSLLHYIQKGSSAQLLLCTIGLDRVDGVPVSSEVRRENRLSRTPKSLPLSTGIHLLGV